MCSAHLTSLLQSVAAQRHDWLALLDRDSSVHCYPNKDFWKTSQPIISNQESIFEFLLHHINVTRRRYVCRTGSPFLFLFVSGKFLPSLCLLCFVCLSILSIVYRLWIYVV